MSNRGTPDEVSDGQFATIVSKVVTALPRAIEASELDAKTILKHIDRGDRLSLALAAAFKMLCNGHEGWRFFSYLVLP